MDGVNLKPYETEAGYITLKIAISLIGVDNNQAFLPDANTVINEARKQLSVKDAGKQISTLHWKNLHKQA